MEKYTSIMLVPSRRAPLVSELSEDVARSAGFSGRGGAGAAQSKMVVDLTDQRNAEAERAERERMRMTSEERSATIAARKAQIRVTARGNAAVPRTEGMSDRIRNTNTLGGHSSDADGIAAAARSPATRTVVVDVYTATRRLQRNYTPTGDHNSLHAVSPIPHSPVNAPRSAYHVSPRRRRDDDDDDDVRHIVVDGNGAEKRTERNSANEGAAIEYISTRGVYGDSVPTTNGTAPVSSPGPAAKPAAASPATKMKQKATWAADATAAPATKKKKSASATTASSKKTSTTRKTPATKLVTLPPEPSKDAISYSSRDDDRERHMVVTSLQRKRAFDTFMTGIEKSCTSLVLTAIMVETLGYYIHSSCDPPTDEQLASLKALKRKRKGAGIPTSSNTEDAHADGDYLAGLAILAVHRNKEPTMHILPFGPKSSMVSEAAVDTLEDEIMSHRDVKDALRRLLLSSLPTICFRAQQLQRVLMHNGITLPRAGERRMLDPALMSWLNEPELKSYDLGALMQHYGVVSFDADGAVPALEGATRRLLCTLHDQNRLADHVLPKIADMKAALDRETHIASLLAKMEVTGFAFTPSALKQLRECIVERVADIDDEAKRCLDGAQINLASAAQVSDCLFHRLGLSVPELRDKNKTHTSTRDEVLQKLKSFHPLPGLVLRYRHLNKLLSTWILPMPLLGRPDRVHGIEGSGLAIYPYWLNATATGRLSCTTPNIQATPKLLKDVAADGDELIINIRSAFKARHGSVLVACDYSQMEVRVLAHLSKDEKLVSLLNRAGASGDVFQMMVEWIASSGGERCERDHMKRTVYGIVYGQSSKGLSESLNISVEKAKDLIDRFLSSFPGVKAYIDSVKVSAARDGFVRMISSRKRPLPGITSDVDSERARAERQSINTIIQGSAADIIKVRPYPSPDCCFV